MGAIETLQKVSNEISGCTKCNLHYSRKLAVPGEGQADAKVMFIGEGPGFHENQQGRPFVGAAGMFLNELLDSANLKREEVFITNVVKCRPPGNRDPQPDELEACWKFLQQQIAAINPRVIVTLGRFSMARFFGNVKISQNHGEVKAVDGRLVVAMYHPAAALHQPSLKTIVMQDFAKLPEYIRKSASMVKEVAFQEQETKEKNDTDDVEGTQLSLF